MNRKYRKTVIAGNWKMNMTASEIKPFIEQLKEHLPKTRACALHKVISNILLDVSESGVANSKATAMVDPALLTDW